MTVGKIEQTIKKMAAPSFKLEAFSRWHAFILLAAPPPLRAPSEERRSRSGALLTSVG